MQVQILSPALRGQVGRCPLGRQRRDAPEAVQLATHTKGHSLKQFTYAGAILAASLSGCISRVAQPVADDSASSAHVHDSSSAQHSHPHPNDPTTASDQNNDPARSVAENAKDPAKEPAVATNSDPRVFEVEGLTFRVPEAWERQTPQSSSFVPRIGQFRLPGSDAGSAAELAVTQAGGSVEANITRWIGQFKSSDDQKPAQETIDVAGAKATFVDVRGEYSQPSFMAKPGDPAVRSNYRMLGVVLDTGSGQLTFFKAIGPDKTLESHRSAFLEFIRTGRKSSN